MLNTDRKIEKIYYTIGEVSELFEVNPSLIRFWEKEFDILKPQKNKKGNRLFTARDLENLKIIYHLVKERGYTLQGAREKIRQNRDGIEKNVEIIESLQKIRGYLLDIKSEL
jgi:DNA-binding transcriptional MerR regulator